MAEALIPKHGGYRNLKGFRVARLIYDVTVRFCDRYIEKRSRTHDQMVQAARSSAPMRWPPGCGSVDRVDAVDRVDGQITPNLPPTPC